MRSARLKYQGHAIGQIEFDDITIAGDFDAGAGGAAPQLGFVTVLIDANHADHRALATFSGVITAKQASDSTDGRADQGTALGAVGVVGGIGLAGVGGAAAEQQAGGDDDWVWEAMRRGSFGPAVVPVSGAFGISS